MSGKFFAICGSPQFRHSYWNLYWVENITVVMLSRWILATDDNMTAISRHLHLEYCALNQCCPWEAINCLYERQFMYLDMKSLDLSFLKLLLNILTFSLIVWIAVCSCCNWKYRWITRFFFTPSRCSRPLVYSIFSKVCYKEPN